MSERQQKGGSRAAEVGGVFEVQDAHTQLKLPGISVSRQERGQKNATHWSFIVFRIQDGRCAGRTLERTHTQRQVARAETACRPYLRGNNRSP